jgi:uncharacterized protein with von Willebrand factor type A (vWA) domain
VLIDFFLHLRSHRLPVSTKEYLTLLEALRQHVCDHSIDAFYYLARACLVKDESHFDQFDRAFGEYFKGVEDLPGFAAEIPADWLTLLAKRHLSAEDKARLEKLGWDKLMEEFEKRLREQKERHQGGSKWIGTGGSSPFGAHGFHPEGIRVGPESAGNRTAVRVWDEREYRNLDGNVALGTRNIKIALRRLRRFARQGAPEELDLDATIQRTARNAGWLDLHMRPERHNAVKVLLLLDVGGSMDWHVQLCEELFSAARAEFKHLEHFYFHNCLYDFVWRDNRRRNSERLGTLDLMHKYPQDYRLIFVGDAAMSPHEILSPGGSLRHVNGEPGEVWMRRMLSVYPKAVWLNPEPEDCWNEHASIGVIRRLMGDRMFPLTLDGLERAMRNLSR